MARPEHPRCIMTPEIIRAINEEQRRYDEDPAAYERHQREIEEQRQWELEQEIIAEREYYERMSEQRELDALNEKHERDSKK